MKPKLLTRLIASAFFVASTASTAAGLGKITVMSALGEPLRAEIDLVSLQKDELATLSARIGSPDAYQRANIEYSSALPTVKLTIEKRPGGQPFITLTSTQPVNEPYLDLLVELESGTGKLSREYAILIDPAGVPAPTMVAAPEVKQSPEERAKPAEKSAQVAQPEVPAPSSAVGETYGPVKFGDTLSGIARANKPGEVSVDQMLVALFKANPAAFAGKNMNRLKTGSILRMPDSSDLAGVGRAEASQEVKLQSANWNAYRQQLAAAAPSVPEESARQTATGRITATVEDETAGKPAQDVLRLSKADMGNVVKTAGGGGKGTEALQNRVKSLEEELTAREKALQEANDRVAMLEKSVKDMQRLIEIKSPVGAEMQKQAVGAAQPATAALPAAVSKPADVAVAPEPAQPADATASEAAKPTEAAAAPPAVKPVEPAAAPVATESAKPPEQAAAPAVAEPSWVDSILEEPLYLAAGAGGMVLLAGLAVINRRRAKRKSADESEPAPEQHVAPEGAPESVNNEPVSPEVASADEMGALDEASRYLALGRDAQAEQVLKEALRTQPGQPALLLKLLEVHSGRKDKRAFQSNAQELLTATGGSGDIWLQAARMGHAIDPENALYAAAATAVGTASDLDFDLDVVAPKGLTETDITIDASHLVPAFDETQVIGDQELRQMVEQTGIQAAATDASSLTTTDFDIDAGGSEGTNTSVAVDVTQVDAGGLGINLDLPPEALASGMGKKIPREVELDLNKPATTPTSSEILDFDLSGISLDLDATATTLQSSPAAPMKSDHWFDVQTKFDLAKAYQEMGDKESAREILKEVLEEGDVQQRAEAKALLEALA